MKIYIPSTIQNAKTVEDIRRFLSEFAQNIENMFSSKLTFSDHMKSKLFEDINLVGAHMNKLEHNLGVVPKGYILIKNDSFTTIISNSGWTSNEIYLTPISDCKVSLIVIAR